MTTTDTTTAPASESEPTLADQAPRLLGNAAGYVGHRTTTMGLRTGMLETLADQSEGLDADGLADRLGYDTFYTGVWCRCAHAAGLLVHESGRYRLAPHVDTLLLDATSPAYVGGLAQVLEMDELFDRFERLLPTGKRVWWDDSSPQWIAGVAASGAPFYTRLIPGGLSQVPGLADRLSRGGRIVDTACGAGTGLVRLAEHYPACEVVGVDGDAHTTTVARDMTRAANLDDRVRLETQPLEEMTLDQPAALVVNNISMHECRDIDAVTRCVWDALEPGGWFVISDFPFPTSEEGLQSIPGRIMAGVQLFEAQIDDQLLPREVYDDLLTRHGFEDVDHVELAPVHALTWGRRPQ